MSDQPEALRLADRLERVRLFGVEEECWEAADELRRQHDEIEQLKAERDAAVKAMKEVSTFLDHCWRDVPMNDFSFEWLERMIAAIDAARGEK